MITICGAGSMKIYAGRAQYKHDRKLMLTREFKQRDSLWMVKFKVIGSASPCLHLVCFIIIIQKKKKRSMLALL